MGRVISQRRPPAPVTGPGVLGAVMVFGELWRPRLRVGARTAGALGVGAAEYSST
jgi:hypothetical protein